jgi:AcrR family transcriptional regulator
MTERFSHAAVPRSKMSQMSDPAEAKGATAQPVPQEEGAKRRQILEGARSLFLASGFDATSMGEIARHAGVSKGTLYVYFDSKERLFEAIIESERRAQAEQVFALDSSDPNVEGSLTRLGVAFVRFLCRPDALGSLRTVIAIAERMPELGRNFYQTGPAFGIARLASYLTDQVAAGVLAVPDCEIAAAQFLDACQSTLFKPLLFNAAGQPTQERIDYVVGTAVRTFLAAYKAR